MSLVLPTLWGWLLILVMLGLLVGFAFRNMAVFLTVNEPVGAIVNPRSNKISRLRSKTIVKIYSNSTYKVAITHYRS